MADRRLIDWQIRPSDDGNLDLYLGDRVRVADSSRVEILKYLKKHRTPRERIHEVADDGYVQDVTRSLERRLRLPVQVPVPRRSRKPVRMPLIRF